jgi:regulatory protein
LLAVRPRTRRELQRRLIAAGFDEAEVEEVLARLESVRLVDDAAFARDFVQHGLTVGRTGRRAMTSALHAKGVDRGIVEEALGPADDQQEEARARELAEARAGRVAGLQPAAAYRRLVSFLIRRGYGPEVARRAATAALRLEATGE